MSGYKIYAKIGTIMKWHKYEHENRNYHFVHFCFPSLWKRYFTFQRVTPPDHSAFLSMLFLPSQASHVPNLSGGVCLSTILRSSSPSPTPLVSLCPSCSVCGHIIWGHCYLRLCCSRWPPADGASQSCCSTCVRPEALARGSRDRLRSRPAPGPTPAGRRGRTSPGTSRTWYCYGAVQEEGDIRLWADDEIPNTIYLLYTWCSFTCKHTTYNLKWNTMCKYLPYQNSL